MKVSVKVGDLTKTPAGLLTTSLFEDVKNPGGATGAVDTALKGLLTELIKEEHFEGKEGQVLLVQTHGKIPAKRVLLVGLGKQERFSVETIRKTAAVSLKKAKEVAAKTVASVLHGAGTGGIKPEQAAEAMAEGVLLASYQFSKHKGTDGKDAEHSVSDFAIIEQDAKKAHAATRGVVEGTIDAQATMYARDLVNEPPSYLTPTALAEEAKKLAKIPGVSAIILDRKDCEKLGMGAFLGVAKGSDEPPKFIHLRYKPAKSRQRVVIIGKGITFDSGGLSIKDRKGMITMKMDMAGASAVLGVFSALPKLKLPIEVHGIIASTENMPSGQAYKPGDVVKAMNGKTIEVIDTDAEGRITLADALSYGVTLKPDAMIDLATLTGSVVAGLGDLYAGMIGNNRFLLDQVKTAAKDAGEHVWELPLAQEYKDLIKSHVADMKNVGGREGDVINASLLLEEFVGGKPWVHLDIAGPAWADKPTVSYISEGGTGFGVRTLLHYLRAL